MTLQTRIQALRSPVRFLKTHHFDDQNLNFGTGLVSYIGGDPRFQKVVQAMSDHSSRNNCSWCIVRTEIKPKLEFHDEHNLNILQCVLRRTFNKLPYSDQTFQRGPRHYFIFNLVGSGSSLKDTIISYVYEKGFIESLE